MTRRHENKSRANQGNGFASAILVGLGFFAGGCSDDKPSAPVEFPIEDAGGRSEAEAAVSVEAGVASRFSRASRGAAIDISEDDSLLVAVNRDVNTVSVFDVAYAAGGAPTLTKKAEVAVCAEPHQIALSPAGDRAYVVCRKDQKLLRLDNLRSAPVKGLEVAVGSEPTGLALTPKGKAVWIANWIDGTVLEIDAEAMTVTTTVDLNAALAATGMLGAGIAARPALAHPRSVVITTNKDDVESDESVFVTEFFAQQKEPLAADGANADIAKQGVVYRIGLRDKKVQTITLPPIADIGFHDHNDQQAGCYPNQLQAIDVQGSFAYVVSICASPKGPLGAFTGPNKAACTADATCPGAAAGSCDLVAGACKTNCTTNAECGLAGVCDANICKDNFTDVRSVQTPAVSVIDTGANRVVASVSLNAEFDKLYASLATPDTSERRLPLNATDMAFIPGTLTAYFAAHGADAVFRVAFNATYETKAVDAVGSQGVPFISLNRGTFDASKVGKLPIGIVMTHKSRSGDAAAQFAFVANDATRNVTVIDTKTGDIAGLPEQPTVAALTAMPTEPAKIAELEGKHLFSTGLGRWSLSGQGWAACSSCHWDALSDQVTWFHLRGPRQSPSLDGTVNSKNPQQIRAMNWSAIVDELEDHEGGALRTIAGGVGAIVKNFDLVNTARVALDRTGHAGLNGSAHVAANPMSSSALVTDVCVLDDWAKLSIFQSNLRTPRKPSNLDSAKVLAGKDLFVGANCQGCHGGDMWTIAKVFYTPDPNTAPATNVNKTLKTLSWKDSVTAAGLPSGVLPTTIDASMTMRYNGTRPADLDALTCMLRQVGTFNVAEAGVGIAELRRNMVAPAQGNEDTGKGYNVPGLLGLSVGAPYFHAGNARTLEAVLSDAFAAHHAALSPGFLAATDPDAAAKRAALIQFILSIDEDTAPIDIPALGPAGGIFCAAP